MTIDNPMAFPTHDANPGTDPRSQVLTGGMTLRDYFAAAAIPAAYASVNANSTLARFPRHELCRIVARNCYEVADAMLAYGVV